MQTTANDYKLNAADLPAIRIWMKFLETFGSGMPPADNAIRKFFAALPALSEAFDKMTNPSYRWMMAELFAPLDRVPNNREVSISAQYADYCEKYNMMSGPGDAKDYETIEIPGMPFTFKSYWIAFLHGYGYRWLRRDEPWIDWRYTQYDKGLRVPGVIEDRRNGINYLIAHWDPTPSKDFIVEQATQYGGAIPAGEAAIKVVKDWATAHNMPQSAIITFEAQQRLKMKHMIGSGSLNPDEYLFIFHLMISLCTATAADRAMVLTIVKEPANSIEYENETFINQLLYLSLMHMGNPKGDIKYSNPEMLDMLKDLLALIRSTDEASIIIKASIEMNINMLHATASYPMVDIYNPEKSFNTRFTDTLAALEDARAIIKTKLPR